MTACVVLLGFCSYYTQSLLDFHNIDTLTTLALYSLLTTRMSDALSFILILTLAIMLVATSLLLIYTNYTIFSNVSSFRGNKSVRQLVARDIGLIMATVFGIPYLSFLVATEWSLTWVYAHQIESPFSSEYTTYIAVQWILWAGYVSELLMIISLIYAMRTVVRGGFIYNRVKSVFASNASSKTTTTKSGQSSFATKSTGNL